MATFVLVHGAFAGGWVWKKIIPLLRAAGHEVHTTTATGMGDRVHLASPAIDLETYIIDVANVIEYENLTEVTLVGWSYGGMIITGVAERMPERLATLVYLDASVPADGDDSYAEEPNPDETLNRDRAAAEAAGRPGFVVVEPYADWIRSMMPDTDDQAWSFARLTPQPLKTLTQPIRLGNPAAAALPRAFILCTEGKGDEASDSTVRLASTLRASPGWRYRELRANHLAPVSAPQATAEMLISLL